MPCLRFSIRTWQHHITYLIRLVVQPGLEESVRNLWERERVDYFGTNDYVFLFFGRGKIGSGSGKRSITSWRRRNAFWRRAEWTWRSVWPTYLNRIRHPASHHRTVRWANGAPASQPLLFGVCPSRIRRHRAIERALAGAKRRAVSRRITMWSRHPSKRNAKSQNRRRASRRRPVWQPSRHLQPFKSRLLFQSHRLPAPTKAPSRFVEEGTHYLFTCRGLIDIVITRAGRAAAPGLASRNDRRGAKSQKHPASDGSSFFLLLSSNTFSFTSFEIATLPSVPLLKKKNTLNKFLSRVNPKKKPMVYVYTFFSNHYSTFTVKRKTVSCAGLKWSKIWNTLERNHGKFRCFDDLRNTWLFRVRNYAKSYTTSCVFKWLFETKQKKKTFELWVLVMTW